MVGRTTRSKAKKNETMFPASTNTKKKRTVSQRSPVMKRNEKVVDDNEDDTNKENQQQLCNSNMATPTKNKSNNKYSSSPATPGPTPYWKVNYYNILCIILLLIIKKIYVSVSYISKFLFFNE